MTGECKSLDVTLNVPSNQEPCLILLSTLFALPAIPSKLSKSINPLFPKWVLRDTEIKIMFLILSRFWRSHKWIFRGCLLYNILVNILVGAERVL